MERWETCSADLSRKFQGWTRGVASQVTQQIGDDNVVAARAEFVQVRGAMRVQFAVISALIQRELRTRFGRHRLGYLWAFLEPSLQIAVWVVIFAVIRNMPVTHDMTTMLFIATGILPFFLFRNVAQFVGKAIQSNQALLQFPIVSQVDTVIARFLMETVTMLVVAFALFFILIATGEAYFPRDMVGILVAVVGILSFALGFGSFNCMLCILWPTYELLLKVIFRILYFTSGVFFTLDHVPIAAQRWLEWNPVLHGVEKFREAWSYSYTSPMTSLGFLYWCGAIFLLMALVMNPTVRRRLEGE